MGTRSRPPRGPFCRRRQKEARAALLSGYMPELGDRLDRVLANWINHNQNLAKDAGQGAVLAIGESERHLLMATLIAVLLSGVLGYTSFRRIVYPSEGFKLQLSQSPTATTWRRYLTQNHQMKPENSPDPSLCSRTGLRKPLTNVGSKLTSQRSPVRSRLQNPSLTSATDSSPPSCPHWAAPPRSSM